MTIILSRLKHECCVRLQHILTFFFVIHVAHFEKKIKMVSSILSSLLDHRNFIAWVIQQQFIISSSRMVQEITQKYRIYDFSHIVIHSELTLILQSVQMPTFSNSVSRQLASNLNLGNLLKMSTTLPWNAVGNPSDRIDERFQTRPQVFPR